jgi:hypothetical protein
LQEGEVWRPWWQKCFLEQAWPVILVNVKKVYTSDCGSK